MSAHLNGNPDATATILLVEDEDAVRTIVGTVLRRSGYRVLEAASPAAALDVFRQHGASIDLLITDVVMPGTSGPALAESLMTTRPDLRVLLISGYSESGVPLANNGRPNVWFLGKPFPPSVLAGRVGEILSATSRDIHA